MDKCSTAAKVLEKIETCSDDKHTVQSINHICKLQGYLNALAVWINKPHVVDRRLCGANVLQIQKCSATTYIDHLKSAINASADFEKFSDSGCLSELNEVYFDTNDGDYVYVIVRDLHPKQCDKYPVIREVIVLDLSHSFSKCTFIPLYKFGRGDKKGNICEDELVYQFSYCEGKSLTLHAIKRDDYKVDKYYISIEWLKTQLFCKIQQWSREENLKTSLTSLRLIPVDKYNELYCRLKFEYGQELVKVWPECTDPQKFVYEDIAIAAYLLLLWEQERKDKNIKEKQSFIDLGCGNGLLVYLLTKEGHPGKGIDLRRRNIWDMFTDVAVLEEMSLTPSADTLFPDTDWLIGNHSDELTPWIPVITARSSHKCCYFVLPCCFHDFDSKFCGKKKGCSQYRTYLDYIKQVGEVCGFCVEEDTLRIPSTKRICFIGKNRTYSEERRNEMDEERSKFILSRCKNPSEKSKMFEYGPEKLDSDITGYTDPATDQLSNVEDSICDKITPQHSEASWATNFTPRSNVERTRNCVTLNQCVKDTIVHKVFQKILTVEDSISVVTEQGKHWQKGGSIPLGDIAAMFDKEILQQMKCECGGIQTLLRNHSHIFQVSGGCVQLRDLSSDNPWSTRQKEKRKNNSEYLKTSLCWFFTNHPDGCPRTSQTCPFAHGETELKPRPANKKRAH